MLLEVPTGNIFPSFHPLPTSLLKKTKTTSQTGRKYKKHTPSIKKQRISLVYFRYSPSQPQKRPLENRTLLPRVYRCDTYSFLEHNTSESITSPFSKQTVLTLYKSIPVLSRNPLKIPRVKAQFF